MKKATEEFYCLPCDREAWKESIPLCCRFEFVIGNCTSLPEDHLTTNWRSMPFHLCAVPIIDSDRPCNLLEIAGRPPLRIRADEMIFVPSGVRHRITQIGDKHVPYSLWMHFRCDVLDGIDILDFFQMPNRLERSQAATPRRWLEELVAQPHLLDFSESLRQQLLGNAFLLELLRCGKPRQLPHPEHTRKNFERLREIFHHLENSARPVPNAKLAAMVHLSLSRFMELFRATAGVSPKQFHENLRFQKSCRLLLHTAQTTGQIAEELGYHDAFHFSKCFKARCGCAPSQFRRAYGINMTP